MADTKEVILLANSPQHRYSKSALLQHLKKEDVEQFFPNGLHFNQGIAKVSPAAAKVLEGTKWFGKEFGVSGTFKPTSNPAFVKMMGADDLAVKAEKKETAAAVKENDALKAKVAELEKKLAEAAKPVVGGDIAAAPKK